MDLTYDSVNKEQAYLEKYRKDYEPLKRICCDMAYPGRVGAWDAQFSATGLAVEGREIQSRVKRIYDPTAGHAFQIWSSGILGNYITKGYPWFAEELTNRKLKDTKRVIKWLQDTDDHIRSVLRASGGVGTENNYYTQKAVAIQDIGGIGDSFMYIERDKETGKQFMLTPHPKEFWLRRDYWGRVLTIHHKTVYAMQDLVDEFGMTALSTEQALKFREKDSDKDTPVTVIRGCYKNRDYQPGQPGVKNMRWQIVYINIDGKHKILQTGSEKINPIPSSLNRPSSEMYGRGVIAGMLIEILTANFIAKDMLKASSQAVQPAMLMPQALRNKLDMGAGAVNFVNTKEMHGLKMGDLVARLTDSGGYPFGVDQQKYWQDMINDRLGVSLFLALNMEAAQGYKNVEHIDSAKVERAIVMTPILLSLDGHVDMELDRVLNLEVESGDAPEIPAELEEFKSIGIDINHIGPLNQLLKHHYEVGGLERTIESMKRVMEIDPDAALVLETDELARRILRGGNSPEDIIRSREDVMEIKAIAAQQAEDARMLELAAKGAELVPNLSKKIEKDSFLADMKAA